MFNCNFSKWSQCSFNQSGNISNNNTLNLVSVPDSWARAESHPGLWVSSHMAMVETVILQENRMAVSASFFLWKKVLKCYDNADYADMPLVQPTMNWSAGLTQRCLCPLSRPRTPVSWLQLPVKIQLTVSKQWVWLIDMDMQMLMMMCEWRLELGPLTHHDED